MTPKLAEISPETTQILIAQSAAANLSVEEYLQQLLGIGANGKHQAEEPALDEFIQALDGLAEDVPPLPRDFSREDIYFPHQ